MAPGGKKRALRETRTSKLWGQPGILKKHNQEIHSELRALFGFSAFFIQNVRKRL